MTERVDRDKLRAACWCRLEPLLNEFWENFKHRSGHEQRDSFARHLAVDIARGSVTLEVDEARELLNCESEPDRSRAAVVLGVYEELINEFFDRQRRLTEQ